VGVQKGVDVREQRTGFGKERVVRGGAARVPVAEILPFPTLPAMEDLPLGGEHKVRLHREFELRESLDDVLQLAPGIHRPKHAAGA
jgi:hypothetical protein